LPLSANYITNVWAMWRFPPGRRGESYAGTAEGGQKDFTHDVSGFTCPLYIAQDPRGLRNYLASTRACHRVWSPAISLLPAARTLMVTGVRLIECVALFLATNAWRFLGPRHLLSERRPSVIPGLLCSLAPALPLQEKATRFFRVSGRVQPVSPKQPSSFMRYVQ